MTLLGKEAQNKHSKGNALAIGKEAREAKALNKYVIDSTIGMLFDEEGEFFTFKTVEEASAKLSAKEKYSYGSTAGDSDFHDALYDWIFREDAREFKETLNLRCIATPGGSGAICNTFSNYLSKGDKVLLPSLMWTNYIQIAQEEGLGYDTYELFDNNNKFNNKSFEENCLSLKRSQGRVLVVINDPCQNPTGYTMTYEEWIGVIDTLNTISRDGTPVVLLYDMAYIDYDIRGFESSRRIIRMFKNLNENVLTILAFSGSKTLGLYGLRVGAQICLTKSKDNANDFVRANDFSARGMWSGTSTLGQNIIKYIFKNHKSEFEEELEYARKLLIDRANTFKVEAMKYNLKHYPYVCGFFVTIPCENPQEVFNQLKEKGLYVLPLARAIRLTLSSITLDEVRRSVKLISEIIN